MSNAFKRGDLTLFTCPRIRRPAYWQCIKLVAPPGASLPPGQEKWSSDDAVEAYCLRCNVAFPFQKGSSASVRRHMTGNHPRELEAFNAGVETEGEAPADSRSGAKRSSSESSMDDDEPMEPSEPDSSVCQPLTKKKRTKRDDALAAIYSGDPMMMDLLIRWICGSLQPLSTVVESGFINLVSFLSMGKTALPDRETVCRIVEHKAAEQRFENMQRVHHEVGHFSLSAEIWQSEYESSYGREKYLVLLCHHVNSDFEPAAFSLGVVNTGDGRVDKLVNDIMREWGVSVKKVSLFLSNNDNMVCQLAADLNVKRFPDMWAVVQTSLICWTRASATSNAETTPANIGGRVTGAEVEASSDRPKHVAQSNVALVIADLKKLADYFDYDWGLKKTLMRAQITGGDEESLKIRKADCNSWEEVYDFLTELMVWRPSINRFFATSSHSAIAEPTAKMWFVAEALLLLLRTLCEVQQITTKDKARTLPFMIHCLAITKQQLNQGNVLAGLIKHYRLTIEFDATEISQDLLTLQRSILEGISTNVDSLLSELQWCSLLDPRYAKMEHVSEDKRELCKLALAERALELHRKDAPAPGLMHRLLQEEDVRPTDGVELEETRICIAEEVSTYVTEHQQRKKRITDPFSWWRDNRKRYPFLSPLARVWLGTVGCSSASIGGLRRRIPFEVTLDNHQNEKSEDLWETMINILYLHACIRKPKADE